MTWKWNVADANAGLTFSGGDLTVANNATQADRNVRGTVSVTTEDVYWELLVVQIGSSDGFGVGAGNGSMSLSGWPGAPSNGVAAFRQNSSWDLNGAGHGAAPTHTTSDRLGLALRGTLRLLWMTKDGTTWYGDTSAGNPVTNANGLDISVITGGLFPIFDGFSVNDTCTCVPDAASWGYTPPSGFSELGPAGGGGRTPYNPWPQMGPILAQRRKGFVGWNPLYDHRRRDRRPSRSLLLPNRKLILPSRKVA